MPGSTPVFGIPYPVASDPMDPAIFASMANAVDTVMAGTQAIIDLRTKLPSCQATASMTGLGVASGVLFTITFSTEVWDTHNFFAPTSGNFTIPVDGVYSIMGTSCRLIGSGTVTLWDWVILRNSIVIYQTTQRPSNAGNGDEITIGGLYACNAGDVINLQGSAYQVGVVTDAVARFTLTLACPLV